MEPQLNSTKRSRNDILLPRQYYATSVRSIGYRAFADSGIKKVLFSHGSKIRVFHASAFQSCDSLTDFIIPATVRVIGKGCFSFSPIPQFEGTSINHIKGHNPVADDKFEQIHHYPYQDSYKGQDYIGGKVFKRTAIPSSSTKQGRDDSTEFDRCDRYYEITPKTTPCSRGLRIIGSMCFYQSQSSQSTFVLPWCVKEISPLTFFNVSIDYLSLQDTTSTSRTMNSRLEVIGNSAFSHCAVLDNSCVVRIPNSVTLIESSAFEGVQFPRIEFEQTLEEVQDGQDGQEGQEGQERQNSQLQSQSQSRTKPIPFDTSIPLVILSRSFKGTGLVTPRIMNSEERMHPTIFSTIPPRVIYLGSECFGDSATGVNIHPHSNLRQIPKECFKESRNIGNFFIPTSIRLIQSSAFQRTSFGTFYFEFDPEIFLTTFSSTSSSISSNTSSNRHPNTRSSKTTSNLLWIGEKAFSLSSISNSILQLPDTIQGISPHAFFVTNRIQCIRIPSTIQYLGPDLFFQSGVENVEFTPLVTTKQCENYDQHYWAQSQSQSQSQSQLQSPQQRFITKLPARCFHQCKLLERVVLPPTIQIIESSAFTESQIKEIIFQFYIQADNDKYTCDDIQETKTIKTQSIEVVQPLELITIPFIKLESTISDISENDHSLSEIIYFSNPYEHFLQLQYINTEAFARLQPSVSTLIIYLPQSLLGLGTSVYRASNIGLVLFSENSKLQYIGNRCFDTCTSLKSIHIPQSVRCIATSAFIYSTLEHITFESGSQLEYLSNDCFANTSLQEFIIPKSVFLIAQTPFPHRLYGDMIQFEIPGDQCDVGIDASAIESAQTNAIIDTDISTNDNANANANANIDIDLYQHIQSICDLGTTTSLYIEANDQNEQTTTTLLKLNSIISRRLGLYEYIFKTILYFDTLPISSLGDSSPTITQTLEYIFQAGLEADMIYQQEKVQEQIKQYNLHQIDRQTNHQVYLNPHPHPQIENIENALKKIGERIYNLLMSNSKRLYSMLCIQCEERGSYRTNIGVHSSSSNRKDSSTLRRLFDLYVRSLKADDIPLYLYPVIPTDEINDETSQHPPPPLPRPHDIMNLFPCDDLVFTPDLIPKDTKDVVIPREYTILAPSLFYTFSNLQSVSFEANSRLRVIGEGCFRHAVLLKSIIIPKTVVRIECSAFQDSCIENVFIEEGSLLESLDVCAFQSCRRLEYIQLENATLLGEIPENCFTKCVKLKKISIPPNVRQISQSAFMYNSVLNSVTFLPQLPSGVNIVNGMNIANSLSTPVEIATVTDADVNANVNANANIKASINANAHTSADIEPKLVLLGKKSFKHCSSLKSIEIPYTVLKIENCAFEKSGLRSITFQTINTQSRLLSISKSCFQDCKHLSTVTLPSTIRYIHQNAFLPKVKLNFQYPDILQNQQQLISSGYYPKYLFHKEISLNIDVFRNNIKKKYNYIRGMCNEEDIYSLVEYCKDNLFLNSTIFVDGEYLKNDKIRVNNVMTNRNQCSWIQPLQRIVEPINFYEYDDEGDYTD